MLSQNIPEMCRQADIHHINEDWQQESKKTSGAHRGGKKSGVYVDKFNPQRKVMFKQDQIIAKNIAEYVTAKIMRLLNPDHAELFAPVELAFEDNNKTPDREGRRVYVASEFYQNYIDLYKDAYNAFNFLDEYKNLRKPDHITRRPRRRPNYFNVDPIINLMIVKKRYPEIAILFASSLLLDDIDVHSENIGAIPATGSSFLRVKYRGNIERLYEKVCPVRIDFGGGLGDNRRNFDGELHLYDAWRYISLTKNGPPNYFLTYAPEIFESLEFVQALIQLSCFPLPVLHRGVHAIIENVATYYGVRPLFQFAQLIGVMDYYQPMLIGETLNKDSLVSYISTFLRKMLCQRLESAEKEAKKIAERTSIPHEAFELMKKHAMLNYQPLSHLNGSKPSPAAYPSSSYDSYEAPDFETHLSFIRSTIGALRETATKLDEDETEKSFLIKQAMELYFQQPTLRFLNHFQLTDEIKSAIHQDPASMLTIYVHIRKTMELFVKQRAQQIALLCDFQNSNKDDVINDDLDNCIPYFVYLGVNSIHDYLACFIRPQSKWSLFSDNLENKSAHLALHFMNDKNEPLDNKLIVLLCLLSSNTKTSSLGKYIIDHIENETGINSLRLSRVLCTILIGKFHHDEEELHAMISHAQIDNIIFQFKHPNLNMISKSA